MAQAETTISSHHHQSSTREVSNTSNSIALIPEELMLRKFGSSHPKLKLMRKVTFTILEKIPIHYNLFKINN